MFNWLRASISRIGFGGTQGVAIVANWLAGILWNFESTFLNLTRQGYRGNEVVYACLRLLSTSTPEPPLVAYTEKDNGDREALPKSHPLVQLIRHPNELMTEYEFWELATLHLAIVGRSTWWKERDRRGVPIALWPLRPDRVGPVYSSSDKPGEKVLRGWSYQIPGQGNAIELHRRDVIAFNFPDPAGESGGIVEGLGPLASLAKQIASDNEATNFVGALLANYAAPTVVLKVKQSIKSEAEAKLKKAAFRAEFGGARRGTPAVIDGDADIQTVGFNLRELEFPELRDIGETRISASIGTPAILVGLRAGLSRATYSNAKQAREFFAETTLANYWRRFEDQYTLDVAAEFGENIICQFDTTQVKALAAQLIAQVQPIKDAFASGAATVNEYREALKLDPIPDGDVRFVPSSVQQIPVGGVPEPKQLPPGESPPALPEGGEAASEDEPLDDEEDTDAKPVKHLSGQHDQARHGGASNVGRIATDLRDEAIKSEPVITSDLQAVARQTGATMEGLDFRIKGQASLERKIAADFREKRNLPNASAAGAQLTDVLRYTMTFPPNKYADGVTKVLDTLKQQGYTLYDHKAKNYWQTGIDYKGINMALVKGKQKFELQFHTKNSFETKEVKNHKLYEQARVSRSSKVRKTLIQQMAANWRSVVIPARVGNLMLVL